jgi:hypothetical protein
MNKKDAVKVLIKHSFLLTDELKNKLLLKIEIMNENQINTLGKFLADEKRNAIKTAPKALSDYDEFLDKLKNLLFLN